MGNNVNSTDTTSVCGFQIIPNAATISKSSLHIPAAKQSLHSQSTKPFSNDQTVDTHCHICTKDHTDSPDTPHSGSSANSPHKRRGSLTQNDFHVMQVSLSFWNLCLIP